MQRIPIGTCPKLLKGKVIVKSKASIGLGLGEETLSRHAENSNWYFPEVAER